MVIRSTVKPYEKSMPEGSEDRQNAAQQFAAIPPVQQQAAAPAPLAGAAAPPPDTESAIDGCNLGNSPATPDEELPPADGGVLR